MNCIKYSKISQYKYWLREDYEIWIDFLRGVEIKHEYFTIEVNGRLTIHKDYCWDGPSGPTIDTPDFMRGSLVHDVLYQAMRLREIDYKVYRFWADELLYRLCLEDGMPKWRAWYVYHAVRWFAEKDATRKEDTAVYVAP